MGVREAARELGVNPSTVSRQLRAGIIPNRGSERAPKVLLSEARAARERNLDQSKQRGPESPLFASAGSVAPPEDSVDEPEAPASTSRREIDYSRARTVREGYLAKSAQLDLEERLGNLLDRAETVDAFFTLGQSLREAMERRAPELAARLLGISDLNQLTAILAEEDRKLLQSIADDFRRNFVEQSSAAA